jgi:hypothetical protein
MAYLVSVETDEVTDFDVGNPLLSHHPRFLFQGHAEFAADVESFLADVGDQDKRERRSHARFRLLTPRRLAAIRKRYIGA